MAPAAGMCGAFKASVAAVVQAANRLRICHALTEGLQPYNVAPNLHRFDERVAVCRREESAAPGVDRSFGIA